MMHEPNVAGSGDLLEGCLLPSAARSVRAVPYRAAASLVREASNRRPSRGTITLGPRCLALASVLLVVTLLPGCQGGQPSGPTRTHGTSSTSSSGAEPRLRRGTNSTNSIGAELNNSTNSIGAELSAVAGQEWGVGELFMHVTRRLSVINVDPSGDLVAALASASPGDELVLADGTYTPAADGSNALVINKDIIIRAQNTGGAIFDGQNTRRVIKIESGSVTLSGLNIVKGHSSVCASGF